MKGGILWKRKEGSKVAMDVSTTTGFKFQGAVGRLRKSVLKLEKLFDQRRFGGENTNDRVSKTSSTEGRCRAIKMGESFPFQSKCRKVESQKGTGSGLGGNRMRGKMAGAKKGRSK